MNNELQASQEMMPQANSSFTAVEQTRALAETQAMFALAKRFPRDSTQAYNRIMKACQRRGLAEQAKFSYPRGGQIITGETIRLLEAIAQNWGNVDFGLKIDQRDGESLVTAYAVDLETNVRRVMNFVVRHTRDTKKGPIKLTDERDIYELASNMGSRRLRKCLEGIIPTDIIEAASEECEKTLKSAHSEPLSDRIRKLVVAFGEFAVTQEMIEKRLQYKVDAMNEQDVIAFKKIYISMKNGATKRDDWFSIETAPPQDAQASDANALNAAIKEKAAPKKKSEDVSDQA